MALRPTGVERISTAVRGREAFRHGNVKGMWIAAGSRPILGRLPARWTAELITTPGPVYVVYSYATPIGWYANGHWTIPPVRYSVTTTNHQNVLLRATEAWGSLCHCGRSH